MENVLWLVIVVCIVFLMILLWRNAKSVSQLTHQRLQQDFNALNLEQGKAEERLRLLIAQSEKLSHDLAFAEQGKQAAERNLESTTAYLHAQQEKFADQKQEMEAMKRQLNTEFQNLANRILEEKTQKFTQLNQQNLAQVLDPFKEKIKLFEQKVDQVYQVESSERNMLKGALEQLMVQSAQIKDEANNLAKALKGDNKKQGNWGEVILEKVLERSGLLRDQEFKLQVASHDLEGKRFQPDAIIYLPDDKHLIVDAKLSLVAYDRAVNAESDADLAVFIKQHVQSIENHVRELSSKDYQSLYGIQSPDFVLLFIPIESSLSLAINAKPELFSDAWDRKVVIVSPSTLLATLRTIASVWKQERQNKNVMEIAREAGLLYDKFVGFMTDMDQVQDILAKASTKQQDAIKKLSHGPGNIVRKIELLKSLGAKTNKQIQDKFLD